jgi:hypothetical protein
MSKNSCIMISKTVIQEIPVQSKVARISFSRTFFQAEFETGKNKYVYKLSA